MNGKRDIHRWMTSWWIRLGSTPVVSRIFEWISKWPHFSIYRPTDEPNLINTIPDADIRGLPNNLTTSEPKLFIYKLQHLDKLVATYILLIPSCSSETGRYIRLPNPEIQPELQWPRRYSHHPYHQHCDASNTANQDNVWRDLRRYERANKTLI